MQTTKTDRWSYFIPPLAPTLRVLYSGGKVLDTPAQVLHAGTLTIGRNLAAAESIALPDDERASRLHACVRVSAPQAGGRLNVELSDESSKNGTFVNGHRIISCMLEDGDVVRIGDSVLLMRCEPARQVDGLIKSLIGQAPCVRLLRSQLAQAAPTGAPVLLLGETGTGKELAAQALHKFSQASGRSGPLVAINAATIPEALAESQLFGHVAGAFSDARTAHDGFFRAAQGGTLFLDEIGELPFLLQSKLLRALEEKAVIPIGATRPIACDVRLVAATHGDLKEAMDRGRFRGDLYARLSAIPIELPPLRARREDVLLLLAHHWGGDLPRLTPRLAEALLLHSWPLNVREMVNLVIYLKMCAADTPVLDLPLVAVRLGLSLDGESRQPESHPVAPPASAPHQLPAVRPLAPPLQQPPIPREALVRMMAEQQGVVTRVAALVGRSRRQVRRWLAYYKIEPQARGTEV